MKEPILVYTFIFVVPSFPLAFGLYPGTRGVVLYMISDPSLEAVQDTGASTHVTPSSANTASNELDTVFSLTQLEGKDAGQQVC